MAASYPSMYPSQYSYTVIRGETLEIKFSIFHKYKNEKSHIIVYQDDMYGDIVATADQNFYNVNTMTDYTVTWDTTDVDIGEYKVEYWMSFYSLFEWHEEPNHHNLTIKVIDNPCKNGHKYDSGKVTKTPTCSETGVRTKTCTACGNTKTETIAKTDHKYGDWVSVSDIQHSKSCICGKTISANHVWNGGVITTPSSHTETGIKTYTCKDCGAIKTENIPVSAEHNYDHYVSISETQHNKSCACGDSVTENHNWDTGEITVPATHTTVGEIKYSCLNCEESYIEEVPKTADHVVSKWETIDEDTHSGLCECGEVITEPHRGGVATVISRGICVDCGIPYGTTRPFADVNENAPYIDAVKYVVENNLFLGTSETEFSPNMTMTRGMFVTVLGRMAGITVETVTESEFSDVAVNEWYAPYVAWAVENKIVLGYDNGKFGPNDKINIEQACVILSRYADYLGWTTDSKIVPDTYVDCTDVSAWAQTQVAWMIDLGIYVGTDNKLTPKAEAMRSTVADMLYRFANVSK